MANGTSSLSDIVQRLATLLGQEKDGATESVRDLLEKAHKLAAYQSAAPTDDLQAMIGQQLHEVATELLDILLGWTSLGGRVELGIAGTPVVPIAPEVVNTLTSPLALQVP